MLGERLKQLRGKRTQKEIAERIGMARSSLTQYESGKIEPNMETLNKLADIYRVTVDYLLGRDDGFRVEEERAFYDAMQQDPDDEFFVDGYLSATEEEKKMVRKFWRDHIWKKRK